MPATHEDVILAPAEISASLLNVHESQDIFKKLLDALSSPGQLFLLDSLVWSRVGGSAITLLALLGHETQFCIAGHRAPQLTSLVRHITTGRPTQMADARYVTFNGTVAEHLLSEVSVGTDLRPDSAAQVTINCTGAFHAGNVSGSGTTLEITGPGVDGAITITFDRLDPVVLFALTHKTCEYPRGIDFWFISDCGQVVGIPRSSTVEIITNQKMEP